MIVLAEIVSHQNGREVIILLLRLLLVLPKPLGALLPGQIVVNHAALISTFSTIIVCTPIDMSWPAEGWFNR